MKMNWGTGIAIFYGAFMVIMISFVVISRNVDHSLVMDNYYEADINYQNHKDKVANSKALKTDLIISKVAGENVKFQFPELPGTISGEVLFYKPDDKSKDFKVAIKTDDLGLFNVNTGKLVSGLWRLKVEWKAGDKQYYKEQKMLL